MSRKPLLTLERNNTGRVFIGLTEFDEQGIARRSCVLSDAQDYTADSVMERRFMDMARLMDVDIKYLW